MKKVQLQASGESDVKEHVISHPGISIEKNQILFSKDARRALEEIVESMLSELETEDQKRRMHPIVENQEIAQSKVHTVLQREKDTEKELDGKQHEKLLKKMRKFWLGMQTKHKVGKIIDQAIKTELRQTPVENRECLYIEVDGETTPVPLIVRINRKKKNIQEYTDDIINSMNARRHVSKVLHHEHK